MDSTPHDRDTDPQAVQAAYVARYLRAVLGMLKRRLRQHADTGELTPSQISVLLRLETGGPVHVSALARAEGMQPQSMAPIVAALRSAGLVESAADQEYRRQTLVSLTDQCRASMQAKRAARQDWLTRALQSRLSPAELEAVAGTIDLLRRLVVDD